MRYAYIHKNFRDLNLERKVIFFVHFLTLFLCFFPWFEADPSYESTFFYNAFQGPGFLIGSFIFMISLFIVIVFLDVLLEKRSLRLSFPENNLYFAVGIQQILFLILMWSVLISVGKGFGDHEIRFGLFVVFTLQFVGLVATFLNMQLEKEKKVKSFFQNPQLPLNRDEENE